MFQLFAPKQQSTVRTCFKKFSAFEYSTFKIIDISIMRLWLCVYLYCLLP